MNVALRSSDPTSRVAPQASQLDRAIARVEIFNDLRLAEPSWRHLERHDNLATPYQRYDFLAPWQREVGQRAGLTPAIVVGFDAGGEPLLLCPLARRKIGPVTVAGFLGGKHANFNMALWRRDVACAFTPAAMHGMLARIVMAGPDIDLLGLRNQPENWDGIANPFRLLPHQPSASFGHRGALLPDFDELLCNRLGHSSRKKLRKKERNLAEHGAVRFWRATTEAEARSVLDAFFAQKAERMRALGRIDAFAPAGVRAFIVAAAIERLAEGHPAVELYACSVGDTIVATFGGMADGNRMCGLVNSMTFGEFAPESPGELLLVNVVRMCCERRLATFDLGVGEAAYKQLFCDQPEPLFDSFVPLTPLGSAVAWAARAATGAKRLIKQNPSLLRVVASARKLRAGMQRQA